MVNWKRVLFLVAMFALWYTWPTEGSQPITLQVMPKVMACIPSSRPTIRMTVRIVRHTDNRHLSISWNSPTGQSGLSLIQLDGDSPEVFTLYREIHCADYVLQACVYRVKAKFCTPIETVKGG